jgi:predicted nucleotidyltransferase
LITIFLHEPSRQTFATESARSGNANLELMKIIEANAIVSAVTSWPIKRGDIRAMALVGSWARGNPREVSDIDLLLLSDHQDEYRRRRKWLTEIEFKAAGYQLRSSNNVAYGACLLCHRQMRPVLPSASEALCR